MNPIIRIAIVIFFFLSSATHAALKSEAEMDAVLTKFMGLLKQDKLGEAAESLMKYWPQQDGAALASLKIELSDAGKVNGERFGKPVGTEIVKSCRVGKFLYKAQAVLKYERGFVFWNFVFYNPSVGWELNSYRFDNKNFVPLTSSCE